MRNSLARRVLWVHVILLLALCGVLLRIFVIGQGEQYRQTAAAQSRYTLSAGTARGNIYDCRLRPLVNESEKTVLAVDPTPAAMTALRQGLSAEQFKEIYPCCKAAARCSSPVISHLWGGHHRPPDPAALQRRSVGPAHHRLYQW